MKLRRKIKSIKTYLLNKGIVIIDNEIVSLKNGAKTIIENAYRLFDLENEILVLDDENKPYVFNEELELINKISDFEVSFAKYPFICFYYGKAPRIYGVLDCIKFKKNFEVKEEIGRNIIENYIFTDDLICRDIRTGNVLWQYNLGKKYNYFKEADYQGEPPVEVQAEVIKFLGVYKDELWLVLNSGLLAINIDTGTETRYIKEGKMALGEPFFENFKGYFGYDTVLDEEKGIIFNLNLHFYIEYDLNSNKNYFDSYSFKDSSQKNGLVLNYIGGYDAENIYAYEGSKNNRFAIFSRDKKGIIWSGEIPEAKDKFPAIKDLQYGAGKLYVLDHYNTLHIFEGEINRN
ncbi:hypothetical protein CAPN001_21110 [Capnocytophaga stomatis]|uniref:hypothetical protein n=1 Tax=Capnocytophaga stomatis TaxID=1848904 RepID=UPI00194EC1F7|nr:hypothetical protein [Capnocytophaga stomatis]GIJ92909.1 hypothetical protein CAPN002_01270 [Capnocytophaga stomatis]GIJ97542.1 hypothetical protein CAPN001_21110 [Capnocytophaga stomatis]GIM50084.1 hypothetical protein CAPN003_15360 [Capnocytophaga stomatis]